MELAEVAPPFIEMAHRIVWCTASTVDAKRRPRSRILRVYPGTLLLGQGGALLTWRV